MEENSHSSSDEKIVASLASTSRNTQKSVDTQKNNSESVLLKSLIASESKDSRKLKKKLEPQSQEYTIKTRSRSNAPEKEDDSKIPSQCDKENESLKAPSPDEDIGTHEEKSSKPRVIYTLSDLFSLNSSDDDFIFSHKTDEEFSPQKTHIMHEASASPLSNFLDQISLDAVQKDSKQESPNKNQPLVPHLSTVATNENTLGNMEKTIKSIGQDTPLSLEDITKPDGSEKEIILRFFCKEVSQLPDKKATDLDKTFVKKTDNSDNVREKFITDSSLNFQSNTSMMIPHSRNGIKFEIGSRLEVKDEMTEKWLAATIVSIEESNIVVHYDRFNHTKFDESVPFDSHRLQPLGGQRTPKKYTRRTVTDQTTKQGGVRKKSAGRPKKEKPPVHATYPSHTQNEPYQNDPKHAAWERLLGALKNVDQMKDCLSALVAETPTSTDTLGSSPQKEALQNPPLWRKLLDKMKSDACWDTWLHCMEKLQTEILIYKDSLNEDLHKKAALSLFGPQHSTATFSNPSDGFLNPEYYMPSPYVCPFVSCKQRFQTSKDQEDHIENIHNLPPQISSEVGISTPIAHTGMDFAPSPMPFLHSYLPTQAPPTYVHASSLGNPHQLPGGSMPPFALVPPHFSPSQVDPLLPALLPQQLPVLHHYPLTPSIPMNPFIGYEMHTGPSQLLAPVSGIGMSSLPPPTFLSSSQAPLMPHVESLKDELPLQPSFIPTPSPDEKTCSIQKPGPKKSAGKGKKISYPTSGSRRGKPAITQNKCDGNVKRKRQKTSLPPKVPFPLNLPPRRARRMTNYNLKDLLSTPENSSEDEALIPKRNKRANKSKTNRSRDDLIKCICGEKEDSGLMIQCELCLTWQHCECINMVDESLFPKTYFCYDCEGNTIPKDSEIDSSSSSVNNDEADVVGSASDNDESSSPLREVASQHWSHTGYLPHFTCLASPPPEPTDSSHWGNREALSAADIVLVGSLITRLQDVFTSLATLRHKISILRSDHHPDLICWMKPRSVPKELLGKNDNPSTFLKNFLASCLKSFLPSNDSHDDDTLNKGHHLSEMEQDDKQPNIMPDSLYPLFTSLGLGSMDLLQQLFEIKPPVQNIKQEPISEEDSFENLSSNHSVPFQRTLTHSFPSSQRELGDAGHVASKPLGQSLSSSPEDLKSHLNPPTLSNDLPESHVSDNTVPREDPKDSFWGIRTALLLLDLLSTDKTPDGEADPIHFAKSQLFQDVALHSLAIFERLSLLQVSYVDYMKRHNITPAADSPRVLLETLLQQTREIINVLTNSH